MIARATDAGDVELVAAVRRGDDAAFEELYRRYSRRVAGYVYRMVGDADRAEDITQEAFFSALRRLRRTDGEIAFKPWIFEIAKNAAIDHFRRAGRTEEISLHAEEGGLRPADELRLSGGLPEPDLAYEGKERLEHLTRAFDGLSETHWRILVLRELEGLSYQEIAERMDLTRAAVESTLFRARRRLNEEYAALDTGARCLDVVAAIERLAAGGTSARDRRAVGRHAQRCSFCRREARALGVSIDVPVRSRVAALLPLPLLARRRRGSHAADAGAGQGVQQVAGTWAPALVTGGAAESAANAWGKAAALVATLALAGGGAAVQQHVVSPERGVEERPSAPAAQPRERPAHQPRVRPQARPAPAPERPADPPARDQDRDERAPAGGGGLSLPSSPDLRLPDADGLVPDAGRTVPEPPAAERPAADIPDPEQIVDTLPAEPQTLIEEQVDRASEVVEDVPAAGGAAIRLPPAATEALDAIRGDLSLSAG